MSEAKKFLFNNRDFSDQALEAQRVAVRNAPPTFTEQQVESARNKAFKDGVAEGIRQQKESTEQTVQAILDALNKKIDSLLTAETARHMRFEKDTAQLALSMLHKLYPVLIEHLNETQLIQDIESLIVQTKEGEAFSILVHPEMVDAVSVRFSGQETVSVQSNPHISIKDAMIAWPHGGAQINRDAVLNSIEKSVADALDAGEASAQFKE